MAQKQQTAEPSQAGLAAEILAMEFPNREFSVPIFVGSGAVSSVYRADAGGAAFAVKLHTADRDSVSEYEREEYERERACVERAAAVGVPCPRVFATGWHGNTAYSIQTFIAGVSGLEAPRDPLVIWKELGRLAHLINSITVEDADVKWRNYVASVLAGMTEDDVKITLGLYAAPQQADLRRVFQKLVAMPLRYGLSHCDMHPRNIIVTPEGQVFLLDWGAASRDINIVPHVSMTSLLWELDAKGRPFHAFVAGYGLSGPEFNAFVAGYGLSEPEFNALLPEVLSLDLISCFWFFENPPRSEFGRELVAHAKGLVAEHLPMLTEWASRPAA